jgi:membrane protease YdiL (CAAX protease family)
VKALTPSPSPNSGGREPDSPSQNWETAKPPIVGVGVGQPPLAGERGKGYNPRMTLRAAAARIVSDKATIALVTVTVVASVGHYRSVLPTPLWSDTLLHLGIPLAVILLVFRQSPLDYGLRLGNWREGLAWTAGGMALMGVVALLFAFSGDFQTYYVKYFAARNPGGGLDAWVLRSGVQMAAWEFLFRGFLLFALIDTFGPRAIVIQAVPFALAHFGKPEWETYTSIAGGLLSGWVTYRVRSFYPAWLIHWALIVALNFFVMGGRGV